MTALGRVKHVFKGFPLRCVLLMLAKVVGAGASRGARIAPRSLLLAQARDDAHDLPLLPLVVKLSITTNSRTCLLVIVAFRHLV